MNERIKLLAEQAGLKQRIWNSLGKELPMWQEDPDNPGLEKFAELIVRECERVAKNPQWYGESPSNGWRNPIRHVCREFKEHFGVEE